MSPFEGKHQRLFLLYPFLYIVNILISSIDTHPIRETETHILGSRKAGPTGQSRIFHQVR